MGGDNNARTIHEVMLSVKWVDGGRVKTKQGPDLTVRIQRQQTSVLPGGKRFIRVFDYCAFFRAICWWGFVLFLFCSQ